MRKRIMRACIKKCFVLFLCAHSLWSDALDEKIKNLIGERNYKVNANFIQNIFRDKSAFYANGGINMKNVVQALKNNGLLILKFPSPLEVQLTFVARTSPILLNRTINDILSSMGYAFFNVQKADYHNGITTLSFVFITEHTPDLGIIMSELEKRGISCIDIKHQSAQNWEYLLEINNPQIPNARLLLANQALSLRDVSGQYWLSLQTQGKMKISAQSKWYPRIVLYDRHLRILDSLLSGDSKTSVSVKIPQGVSFVMITDSNNPANLRSGINVQFD